MANGKLGTLAVYLTANTDGLKKGSKEAKSIVSDMNTGLTKLAGAFGVGLGVSAAVSAVKSLFSALDEIGKGADRLSVTTEAYQELRYAARNTAAEMSQVEMAVTKSGQAVEKAAEGDKKMTAALGKLGLTWKDLIGLAPDKQLEMIGTALVGVSDATEKNNIALEIFGKSGTKLMPFFNGLSDLRKEAHALGVIISEDTIRKAEAAGDAFTRMGDKITAMIADSGLIQWLDKVITDVERIIDLATIGGRADFANIDWDTFIADFSPAGTDYADTAKNLIGIATGVKPIMNLMKLYNGEYNKQSSSSGENKGIQANEEQKSTAIALIEQAKAEAEKEDAEKKFSAEVLKLNEQNTIERMRQNGASEEQIALMEAQYRLGFSLLSLSKEQRESLRDVIRDQIKLNIAKQDQIEAEAKAAEQQKKEDEDRSERLRQEHGLYDYMRDRGNSIRQSLLKAGGYDRQALQEQRMKEAATRKGAMLTSAEGAGVARLAALEYRLANLPAMEMIRSEATSNDLARRGGFQSLSQSISKGEDINRKILDYNRRMWEELRNINYGIKQAGDI